MLVQKLLDRITGTFFSYTHVLYRGEEAGLH